MFDTSRSVPENVRQRILDQAQRADSSADVGRALLRELVGARIDIGQLSLQDVKQLLLDALRLRRRTRSHKPPCHAA